MTELDELKQAFEKWLNANEECGVDSTEVAALFWPFVQRALERAADPKDGEWAKDIEIRNRFKKALGMELFAHEVTSD